MGKRRLAGVLMVLALLGAACGGGGDDKGERASIKDSAKSTTTTSAEAAGDAEAATDTTKSADGGGTETTATTAAPGNGDGGGGGGPAAAGGAPEAEAKPLPAPGRYTMSVTGTTTANGKEQPVPPEAAYTVEQLNDTDQRHSVQSGQGQGDTVQVLRATPSEVLLVSLTLGGQKTFQPKPPVRFSPWPLAVDAAWSWTMRSTDELTTVKQESKIVRTEKVSGAGWSVDTFVVETTLTYSGDIEGTSKITSWFAPSHGLGVRQHQVTNASYGVYKFSSDTTAEAKSLTPA